MHDRFELRAALKRLAELNTLRADALFLPLLRDLSALKRGDVDGLRCLLMDVADAGFEAAEIDFVLEVAGCRTKLGINRAREEFAKVCDEKPGCRLVEFRPKRSGPMLGWAAVVFRSGRRIGAIPISLSADGRISFAPPRPKRYPVIYSAVAGTCWESAVLHALEAALVEGGAP